MVFSVFAELSDFGNEISGKSIDCVQLKLNHIVRREFLANSYTFSNELINSDGPTCGRLCRTIIILGMLR